MTSNKLKVIACATMLIDHIGYFLFPNIELLRIIGRISFPIFAFLIANALIHTRSKVRYITTLLFMGILFDLVVILYEGYSVSNIFIVLGITALAIALSDKYNKSVLILPFLLEFLPPISLDYGYYGICLIYLFYFVNSANLEKNIKFLIYFGSILLFQYVFQMNDLQIYAILALPIIYFYNGTYGVSNRLLKYSFYAFYPLHILILNIIAFYV